MWKEHLTCMFLTEQLAEQREIRKTIQENISLVFVIAAKGGAPSY